MYEGGIGGGLTADWAVWICLKGLRLGGDVGNEIDKRLTVVLVFDGGDRVLLPQV